jgi:hypothetical protein
VTGPYLKLDDSLSPDGRWLAFSANPSGKWQLYVRRVSTEGGVQPVAAGIAQDDGVYWSPAASELLFLRGLDLVALRYDGAGDRFVVKDEHVIARLAPGPTIYGISPDGRRVLVGEMVNPAAAGYGIRVVVNGLETLTKTSAQ